MLKRICWTVILVAVILATGLSIQSHFVAERNKRVLESCSQERVLAACRELIAVRDAKLGTNTPTGVDIVAGDAPQALAVLDGMHPASIVIHREYVVMKFGTIAPMVVRGFREGATGFGNREGAPGLWIDNP